MSIRSLSILCFFCALLCALLLSAAPARAQSAPKATAIAVGGDNLTRLLWSNSDASISLWRMNADGSVAAQYPYGPYPGWVAAALAAGADSAPRVLYNHTADGQMSLWRMDPTANTFTQNTYGPYPGWAATALAVGGSNAPRILWNHAADGLMSLWNVNPTTNAFTSANYGPYTGYTPFLIAAGPNSLPRVLWNQTGGAISLWYDVPGTTDYGYKNYGPFSGYTAIALAVDSTNAPRVLWTGPGNVVSLWKVAPDQTYTFQNYADPSGYTPVGMACGTGGDVRLLWSDGLGDAQVWTVAADGTYTAKTYSAGHGTPAADIPPPGWAEEVMPTDDASDADGMGPAAASSVNLASGVEENSPGSDLWAYNPLGPSASYERRYRSVRAQKGYASPGLSPGWTDGYDLSVRPTANGYTLTYDNGGQEQWVGTTGSLGTPAGAPYLANVSGGTLTMTFKDRSKYTFKQIGTAGGNYSANAYLLTGITNLVGHAITLNRDTAANGYRVLSITNDASPATALLTFAYNGNGTIKTVTDTYGRQITYGFTNGLLSSVSQIAATGTSSPPARWQYGYTAIQGAMLLNSVSAPDPSKPGSLTAATTTYDAVSGAVAQHKDASGRVHSYNYMGNQTVAQVTNTDGSLAQKWTQKQNAGGTGMNADTGTTDAAGKTDTIAYTGTPSPYLPSAETNRNGQTSQVAYNDNYGNLLSTTSPRSVVTTFTYGNPADFPLNQVASVQPTHVNASGATDSTQTATTFDYYGPADVPADNGPAGTINGMIKAVHSPIPGTINYNVTVTTTYTYDSLGNVVQVITPNANYAVSQPSTPTYRTTTYNYTSYSFTDAKGVLHSYSQPEALGEPVSVAVSGLDYRATNSGSPEYTSAPQTTSTTTTYYQYDQRGNRTAVIDALGNETDFAYNLADQLTDTLYPATGDSGAGRAKTTMAYQYPGGPASSTTVYDESGNAFRQVSNVYDADGEIVSVSGDTYPVSYTYDGRGRVSSVTYYQQSIMSGSTTYYDYDTVGNLADIRYPNQSGANFDKRQYTYDADNNLIKEIDGLGLEKDYLRADPESLMTGIHYVYPSGYAGTQIADVGFTYDVFGRRASMTDGTGSKTYTYGDRDYLLNETVSFNGGPQNHVIKFAYNSDGSRVSRQLQLQLGTLSTGLYGQAADEFYDGVGRTINVDSLETDNGYTGPGTVENYAYYGNGWLQSANNAYGYQASYTYNPRGFLAGLTNTLGYYQSSATASQFTGIAYDPVGNRLSETATIPSHPGGYGYNFQDASRSLLYSYNNRDELTGEQSQSIPSSTNTNDSYAENYSYGFGYDLAGNTTTFKGAANSFNADNQSGTVTSDGNGNPITYQGSTFSYDPEDRLTNIPGMQTMAYDGDGLRAWKQDQSGTRTYYLYDGSELFREEFWPGSTTGSPQSLYVRSYASGPSSQIFCVKNNIEQSDGAQNTSSARAYLEFYDYDPQGNLVQRLQNYSYAPVIDTTVYDAFGTLHGYAFDGTGIATSLGQSGYKATPFRQGFGGQHGYYTDTQTGLSLLTHRYYDAGTGRFINRDPIGYKGGINLYGFAGNNPVNRQDPNGTDSDAFDPFAYFNDLFSHATPLGVLRSIKNSISSNGNFNLARNAISEAGGIAATYNPYSGEDVIGARVLEAATPWVMRSATAARATRSTIRFERYGSEAEAAASKSANKLLPRPGHEAGTNEKWIGELGTVNPKSLGSKSGHSHRMEIETDASAMEWLRKNATIKPNEPGRYGIPNSKLDEFNKMIKDINIRRR